MISELSTFWITKAKAKVKFGVKSLCEHECKVSSVPINIRKCRGVQKSMGNKVPWKIGLLIYLPVTSRPLISLQKEEVLSPCNFATTHLKACILNFYLPWTSRPMKRRTLFATPHNINAKAKATKYSRGINFTLISVATVLWGKGNHMGSIHFANLGEESEDESEDDFGAPEAAAYKVLSHLILIDPFVPPSFHRHHDHSMSISVHVESRASNALFRCNHKQRQNIMELCYMWSTFTSLVL